ncbi:metal ABC transporter ATP-binding protein [Lacticaseibacillus hegangensis]|uniref:Metal ABC transporter ATP-binding protein n=1 Tax=Lacticaseibacillus hegangensis TaxID=2486010 RepID=A0ABW4CTR2_9LACO|nr:ATP-binding cassette domain-containing protein [Lacticaseibacillus hegangensis]
MPEPILTVEHLTFGFRGRQLYHDLSFSLAAGSVTSLIGANGVGKTTLTKLIMGQLTPTAGRIIKAPQLRLGYVPQFRNIDPEYPLSLRSFVALNQMGRRLPWHSKQEKAAVTAVLKETGLLERQHQSLGMASGGEKQKAYLAQALLTRPNFLILDEATASLDVNTKTELMTLVNQLNQKHGLTVLFVTHDLDLAKSFTQQYLLLTQTGYELRSTDEMNEAAMPKELRPTQEVR